MFFEKCSLRASLPLEYVTSLHVFESKTQKHIDSGIVTKENQLNLN